MSITIATPLPHGEDVVRAGVNSLLSMYSETRRVMTETLNSLEGVTIAAPHPVYTAGLDDILAGALTKSANPSGWRYILLDGDNALAAAEVRPTQQGARFSGINRGNFVGNMVRGVAIAEELEEVRKNDHELRLLQIPSVYVVAIWLHGEEDIFITLPPAPGQIAPYSIYRTREFLEVLREPALARELVDDDSLFQTNRIE